MSKEITDEMVKIFLKAELPESALDLILNQWEKFKAHTPIEKMDWRILQLKTHDGELVWAGDYNIIHCLEKCNWTIHRVKRVSDGEVFTIKDNIQFRECIECDWCGEGEITGFSLKNGKLDVNIYPKGETSSSGDIWREFENIKKAPKKETEVIKPPLGIIPEWLWKEQRLKELREAIKRYVGAKLPVNLDWIVEEYCLREWIESHNEDKKQPGE